MITHLTQNHIRDVFMNSHLLRAVSVDGVVSAEVSTVGTPISFYNNEKEINNENK